MMTQITRAEEAFYITILGLQPRDKVDMLGVRTTACKESSV